MALIWRSLPAWPPYKDADGREWKLAPNGYWWLHHAGFWHQAGSQASGDVLGVPVPAYNPAAFTAVMDKLDEQLSRAASQASMFLPAKTQDPLKAIRTRPNEPAPQRPVSVVSAAPNVPPDFAEISLQPGCCAECHLDDGPLYEGDLCRWCWMLAQLPRAEKAAETATEPPTSVQARRQTLLIAARGVTAIIAVWAAAWLIVYLVAYL